MHWRKKWQPTPVFFLGESQTGAWWAAIYGVAQSRTQLSNFPFTFHFHALEEEMATHSSVLSWRMPGTWEPGGLPSMGSHRVGHNWSDLAAAADSYQLRQFAIICHTNEQNGASPGSVVKNPLVMPERWETRVRSLGQDDPLEEEMATHSSFMAWEMPWIVKPGELLT